MANYQSNRPNQHQNRPQNTSTPISTPSTPTNASEPSQIAGNTTPQVAQTPTIESKSEETMVSSDNLSSVDKVVSTAVNMFVDGTPIQDIYKMLTAAALQVPESNRKEFTKEVRQRFANLKIFSEALYNKVYELTSSWV